MLKAITGRPLWLNVLVGIVLAIGLFALFLLSLNWITGHGKSASVPSVTGKTYEQAKAILKKQVLTWRFRIPFMWILCRLSM